MKSESESRLESALQKLRDTRDAVRWWIATSGPGVERPWPDVPESEVDATIAFVRKIKKELGKS